MRTRQGNVAAGLVVVSAMVGSVPASAQICGSSLAQHEALAEAALRGGSWVGAASGGLVPTLRFRLRAGCAEAFAPDWDWMALSDNPELDGAYEGSVGRRSTSGLLEVVDLRFRFAGGAGSTWIEYELWSFSPEDRALGRPPRYTRGTLSHRR
ncbi:MAG: hypothetical protein ABW252_16555 [Polyangiales bacterium]